MKINIDDCVGCGTCVGGIEGDKQCPTNAISLQDGHAAIDETKCINCGQCENLCALGAVSKE